MQKNKPTTDNNLKNQTSAAIDELSSGIRRATRKIFDGCIQETTELFSDLLKKYTDKLKEKIESKGVDNDTEISNTDGTNQQTANISSRSRDS